MPPSPSKYCLAMTSHDFCEMMKRIDFPEDRKLDPQSFDWAFEDNPTLPFMQWVCSVGKENLLSKENNKEYEHLLRNGQVLTGELLKEALKVSSFSEDDDDEDDADYESKLQSDVDQLEMSLKQVQERKALLIKDCSQLDAKHVALKSKLSKVEDFTSKAKKNYEEKLDGCFIHNSKINDTLGKLSKSVDKINDLYKNHTDKGAKNEGNRNMTGNIFISSEDCLQYYKAEEKFTQDLTAFTKKRFFEGMADIAGARETSQYSIIDVSNPENIHLDASEKDNFMEDCQEFSFLQNIFPQSEINRLNALIKAKKAMAAVQEAKRILHLLKTDQFPTTTSSISLSKSKAEENVRNAKEEADQYESFIPDLVKQLGALQGTEILTGDYDLKLKRQDYFTKNQDEVIKFLQDQRSRSDLLSKLYELELRFHERTHHLLCAAEKTLQIHLENWKQRMKCLDDSDLSSIRFERNVVDSRDVSSKRIYQMMEMLPPDVGLEDTHLYLPLDKVKGRASDLHTLYESSKTSHQDNENFLRENMTELEDCVRKSEAVLYAGTSTLSGLPNLSPADLQASMVSVQADISNLRSNVDKAVTDVKKKQKLLKGNPILTKERGLFALFHTKPEQLVSHINGLEETLKIQDMS